MSSGEIVLLDLEWIAFAAGAAAGDDGNFPGMAAGEEEDFGRNDVDGIHDGVVGLFEESVCISLGEEFTDLPDFGGRVDGAEAFRHDRHFGSSKIFRGGVDLSVGVGDAEVVEVVVSSTKPVASPIELLLPGGVRVCVPRDFDELTLRRLLGALGSC